MAYSISGYIYDKDDNIVANCYYQFLFVKVNSSSHDNIWSDIYQADGLGYYSHDIMDLDMITTSGQFTIDDEVLIAAWTGDSTRSHTITQYSDHIHKIIDAGSDVNIQNIKLFDPQPPIAHFYNLPDEGIVNIDYNMINDSTTEYHIFIGSLPYNADFYQHCSYAGEYIFSSNCIDTSAWTYGDGNSDLFSGITNSTYAWDDAGIYTVTLEVTNNAGLSDTFFEQIIIKYAVIADFIYNPNPGILGSPIMFTNTSSDPEDRVGLHASGKEYKWEFYDGTYPGIVDDTYEGDIVFSPNYIFTSAPDRVVVLEAYWNDGFEDKISRSIQYIQFNPIAAYEYEKTECFPKYVDTSDPGAPPITYYWWTIQELQDSTWTDIFKLDGTDINEIKYEFPNAGKFKIIHKVRDFNDFEDEVENFYDIEKCPCLNSGGVKTFTNNVPHKQHPKVRAKLIKVQEQEKVKIKLTYVKYESKKIDN